MKQTDVQYIADIETISDEELLRRLDSETETHLISCVNWPEFPYTPEVSFNMGYSDRSLAVLFKVKEDHVLAKAMESNGPVWEDSCVEIFIDSHDSTDYFNFETNCIGTRLASRRRSRTDADHFSNEEIEKIRTFGSLPHHTVDSEGEGQAWWRVVVVPFEMVGHDKAPESLKANFYKCGDKCRRMHFLSWSEIDLPSPDFHCPKFFGTLNLFRP